MKKFLLPSLALAGVIGLSSSALGDLVTNGSFETGDLSGWTSYDPSPTSVLVDNGSDGGHGWGITPEDGSYQLYLGSVGTDGWISQDLATTAGQSYELSYWMANVGDTPSDFSVTVGGNVLFSGSDMDPQAYTQYVYDFTAASDTTTLTIAGRQDPTALFVDNISVNELPPSGTPEPMTLGLGVVGVALAVRRRKKASRA